jgi:hypothetical protein
MEVGEMKGFAAKIQRLWVPKVLVLLGLVGLSVMVCQGQATQQFTGHVLDPSGAVVPGADVIVHNEGTGIDTKTVTTKTGDYTVTYLNPGVYDITITKPGFETMTKTSITLDVAQKSTIDFSLTVGAVTQSVSVNASDVQLDLTSSDRGVIISREMINELPLDSQDPYMLFDLTPGTHDFTNPIYPRPFDNPTGNQYANGSPQVSQLNVDGGTNDVGDVGRYGFVPSVEAVQEFKVVMNAYDASYGHSGGSSVDTQLKSGTNSFHGAAYEFARRGGLDAGVWQNNYNGIHPARAPHYRDQYGFEADGPVIIPRVFNGKDRLFYTIQYERMNDILPSQGFNTQSIPNPQWLTGNFGYFDPANPFTSGPSYYNNVTHSLQPVILYDPLTPLTSTVDPNCIANGGNTSSCTKLMHQPFPGNVIPANRIDPVAATILSYYKYLTPNINTNAGNLQPGTAPWTNNWQTLQVENDKWRSAMAKIDYTITPKDKAYLRWSDQYRYGLTNSNDGYPASDPANMNGVGRQPQSMQGAVQWTHVFSPTLLFQLSATADRYNNVAFQGPTFSGNEDTALGFASAFTNQLDPGNVHRFPYINPSALLNADTYGWFGSNAGIGYNQDTRTLTFNPSLTLIHGAHSMRFGSNINFDQWDQPFGGNLDNFSFSNQFTSQFGPGYSDQSGYYSGDSVASLLLGYPNGGTVYQNVHYFYSQHYFAPWFQDDWKITKRLTLNLGLRWDYETPRVERHNKQTGVFLTNVVNPISSQIPSGTVLGNNKILDGGLTFAGVNGQSRGAFHPSKLNFEPRVGFAWNVVDRLVLRGGIGETILGDEINNGTSGFSASTGYTNSNDGGITPYTACPQGAATPGYPNCTGGLGLANPIASVAQPTGSSLGLQQSLGNSISFYNPNYHTPQFWNYSLELDGRISKRDTATIAYVGSREPNGSVSNDLNHVSPAYNAMCDVERGGNHLLCDASGAQLQNPFKGLGPAGSGYYSANTISPGFLTRPYPEFQTITENGWANIGKNWYNSLQATFAHQVSRSLTAHVSYTHSRAMTSSGFIDTVNQIYLPHQVSTSNDVNHSITFDAVGYLPIGKGRMLLTNANPLIDAVIGGWEVSPIVTYYSGFAWRPSGNWEMAQTGAPVNQSMAVTHKILPPDANHRNYRIRGANPCVGTRDPVSNAIIPGPSAVAAGCGSPGQVLFVTAASSYSLGRPNETFGVRQPGAYTFNSSFSKNFHVPGAKHVYLSEATNLQIRVDLLNVFNHPNWDEGYNSTASSIDFGTIGKGPNAPTNTPRYVQLSAKLSW